MVYVVVMTTGFPNYDGSVSRRYFYCFETTRPSFSFKNMQKISTFRSNSYNKEEEAYNSEKFDTESLQKGKKEQLFV